MKVSLKVLLATLLGLSCLALLAAGKPPVKTNPASGKLEKPLHLEGDQLRNPGVFTLDHFKVYQINPQPINAQVQLRGQFDNGFLPAQLIRYERFLNPVSKNNEPIIDMMAHLNWYAIQAPQEPIRTVSFYNQFGLQNIRISQAVALLAPAEKVEPGSSFPQGLDHYKVYEVINAQNINAPVFLVDQFNNEENTAYIPAFFAVPVQKVHNGILFPINNPDDHIVFYRLNRIDFNAFRQTNDQFGQHQMSTIRSELLGVPSHKVAWQ